jgi:hypothetical protein
MSLPNVGARHYLQGAHPIENKIAALQTRQLVAMEKYITENKT